MTTASFRAVIKACGTVATVGAVAAAAPTHAASASAGVSATVIAPVVIARGSDLAFTTPVIGMTQAVFPRTVGLRGSMAGGASAITLESAASLTVSGDTRATYAVTIAPTVTAARTGGEGTVTIAAYVVSPRGATLSSGGPQTVLVGGRIMTGLSQARGAYAGNLPVMFEYD